MYQKIFGQLMDSATASSSCHKYLGCIQGKNKCQREKNNCDRNDLFGQDRSEVGNVKVQEPVFIWEDVFSSH